MSKAANTEVAFKDQVLAVQHEVQALVDIYGINLVTRGLGGILADLGRANVEKAKKVEEQGDVSDNHLLELLCIAKAVSAYSTVVVGISRYSELQAAK